MNLNKSGTVYYSFSKVMTAAFPTVCEMQCIVVQKSHVTCHHAHHFGQSFGGNTASFSTLFGGQKVDEIS